MRGWLSSGARRRKRLLTNGAQLLGLAADAVAELTPFLLWLWLCGCVSMAGRRKRGARRRLRVLLGCGYAGASYWPSTVNARVV